MISFRRQLAFEPFTDNTASVVMMRESASQMRERIITTMDWTHGFEK